VLGGTAGAFLVPALAYLLWAWSLSTAPPPGCADTSTLICRSAREDALAALWGILPGLAAAMVLALAVAAGLRSYAHWRSPTIAFASAVIGAGLVTLVASAVG